MRKFQCLHCGASLGHTNGEFLQVANCIFRLKVTIECVICHTVRKWKPVCVPEAPALLAAPEPKFALVMQPSP